SKESKKAHLGSLIFTEKANYFLSISAGQIIVDRQKYFAVSVSSPIGKLLLGKSENELISFNGLNQNILKIF
ncbi:MAG: 3-oxoacyl-ACP synthase, partial [Polaribacter sp.]|nr:3-oxoacyl-ACP synthase [Polaribacter sp.]